LAWIGGRRADAPQAGARREGSRRDGARRDGARRDGAWTGQAAPAGGGLADIPEHISQRLFVEQATILAQLLRIMSVAGVTTVLLLLLDFHRAGTPVTICGLGFLVCACYGAMYWAGCRFNADPHEPESALDYVDLSRWMLLILGLVWAGFTVEMMAHANDAQRSLIDAICIGLMSTPVVFAPRSIAFMFWVPVTAGSFISLFVVPGKVDEYAVACLMGYAVLTGGCITYLNRKLTERALNAIRLEEQNEVVKLLLRDFEESASDWLWETNAMMHLQRVSPRLAEVAQKSVAELQGPFPQVLVGQTAKPGAKPATAVAKLNRLISQRSAFRDLVIPVIVGGEERSWSLTGKPILDKAGRFIGYHGVGSDITIARRSQEQIAFLARHDSLTRLPNRVLFNEVMHQACARCDTQSVALLLLDLDDFKLVNDTLGHATGDGVLVAVGERIRGGLRDGDTASRLGGDEFAIIVNAADNDEIAVVARRLVDRISRPYHFDGRQVEVGLSIGISVGPRDGNTPGRLMKNADLALYRAKADGGGMWYFYDPEMDEKLQDRRALQADLRQALVRSEFFLEYQPIIDLASSRIIAAEALLRWRHPTRGLLAPTGFITLAEEAGLIAPIGAWVLREACRAAAGWPSYVRIAVNLSPVQFRDTGMLDMIGAALAQSGLEPSRLELEITENTVLETNTFTVDALWKLHSDGVRIALDDFGTGYSSLSYLRRFPFDKIKIDRSFIKDLGREKDDSSIILAIIGLADSMNMVVTAEGVETAEQAALLTSYGCAQAQGFLFCEPMSADDLARLIDATEAVPTAAQ